MADRKNGCNQHYIPQALINRWKIDNKLLAFLPENKISREISSKGIFGSKSIVELSNNKKIEDYLNLTKIEVNFNNLTKEIIEGKYRLNRREIDILGKYSSLFSTFENNFWWDNENTINCKQKELIDSIININHYTNYYIYINPVEPFVLTKSSFRLRYNNHIIFPICPFICLGLGADLMNGKGKIEEELNKYLNEDAISEGRCGNVIVFHNISLDRIKSMCKKDSLQGNYIMLRIDEKMIEQVNEQGLKNWKPYEYLIMQGDNKKYNMVEIKQ